MTEPLQIPERGHADVSPEDWARLSGEAELWRLVERGILRVSEVSRGRFRLHGTSYVGRAEIGGVQLELVEKVPGALRALIGFASQSAFRVEEVEAPTSELGELAALLISAYVSALRGHVSQGLEFRYAEELHVGSLGGGRLDIRETIRVRTRGRRHVAAFRRPVIRHDTRRNRVLLAALVEVERLAKVVPVPREDLSRARGLAQFFHDARDVEVLFGDRRPLVEEARRLSSEERHSAVGDLLALAAVVVARESFELGAEEVGTVPRSWFLNLETLFEHAVRSVLARICAADVRTGSAFGRPVFSGSTSQFNADPDLVVGGPPRFEAIGDVKYKEWPGTDVARHHADLYQLVVHAKAFETEEAFLVFPGERFERRDLGVATTGARTRLFAVDVLRLDAELRRVASVLGLHMASDLEATEAAA
ncbi:MAG: hypothetical protein AABM43_06900 [Actinomycetota bacterium]